MFCGFKNHKVLFLHVWVVQLCSMKIRAHIRNRDFVAIIIFWVRITAYETSEAKVYKKNSLSKLGPTNTGASAMASLIFWNDFLASSLHLYATSFFFISCMGCTITTKPEINFLMKLIFPKKDCIALLFAGGCILMMVSILSRSITIPSLERIWPSSFPSVTTKMLYLAFNDILYLRHLSKICFRW